MGNRRAFGVGCFHFGFRQKTPFTVTTQQYILALRGALEDIPSVSNVSIRYDESMGTTYHVAEDLKPFDEGEIFPYVWFLRVQFSIYIPRRVQAALIDRNEETLSKSSEHFNVSIVNAYEGPVAFIEGVNATDEADPSTFVQVVREFLSKEFARVENGISFEMMGPSPFHADFFLEGNSGSDDVECYVSELPGYDQLVFKCGGDSYPSDDALEYVCHLLTRELGVFYSLERRRVVAMRSWNDLVNSWQELRDDVSNETKLSELWTRFHNHRRAKRLVSEAFTMLVDLEVAKGDTSRQLASTYGKDTPVYLERYLRRKSEGALSYPVSSILDWARYQTEASFKVAEIAALIISGMLGGVVGASITAMMS